jgi:hypothetical protein
MELETLALLRAAPVHEKAVRQGRDQNRAA